MRGCFDASWGRRPMTRLKTVTLGTLAATLAFIAGILTNLETIQTHPSFWVTRADSHRERDALLELIIDIAVPVMELKISQAERDGRPDDARQWRARLDQLERKRLDKKLSLENFR